MAIEVEIRYRRGDGIEAVWAGRQDDQLPSRIDELSLEDWKPVPTSLAAEGLMEDFAYRDKQ